jgi:hypothetical protein
MQVGDGVPFGAVIVHQGYTEASYNNAATRALES